MHLRINKETQNKLWEIVAEMARRGLGRDVYPARIVEVVMEIAEEIIGKERLLDEIEMRLRERMSEKRYGFVRVR